MDSENDIFQMIATTLRDLENSNKMKQLINNAILRGVSAVEIIEKGLRRGLELIGQKYEAGEYFLSELLYAGSIMNDAIEILRPYLEREKIIKKGIIVLGTVRGDIHDIGKNIFKMFAEAAGFEVHDLGVDVDPNAFVKALKETGAKILAMSALLTTTILEMKTVIEHLKQAGIRSNVKVLLGGNAVTKEFAKEIGADAAALDAVEGVKICNEWVE
jgi:methanogenic corrinoid protein MtbC1